jgi:hypothetical protein
MRGPYAHCMPQRSDFRITDHLGLVVAFAGAVLIAIRILASASFNIRTAQVLLETQGPGNVLIGTLISLLPSLVMIAGFALLWIGRFWLGVATLVVSQLFQPVTLAFAFLAISALYLPLWRQRDPQAKTGSESRARSPRQAGLDKAIIVIGLVALVFLGGGIAFSPRPWLPRETITTDSETIDGYVLEESEHELVILEADSGVVVRAHVDDDLERHYCDDDAVGYILGPLPDWLDRPLLGLLYARGTSDYPECQSAGSQQAPSRSAEPNHNNPRPDVHDAACLNRAAMI